MDQGVSLIAKVRKMNGFHSEPPPTNAITNVMAFAPTTNHVIGHDPGSCVNDPLAMRSRLHGITFTKCGDPGRLMIVTTVRVDAVLFQSTRPEQLARFNRLVGLGARVKYHRRETRAPAKGWPWCAIRTATPAG